MCARVYECRTALFVRDLGEPVGFPWNRTHDVHRDIIQHERAYTNAPDYERIYANALENEHNMHTNGPERDV